MLGYSISLWVAVAFAFLLLQKAGGKAKKQVTLTTGGATSAAPSSSESERRASRRLTLQLWSTDLIAASVAGFVLWVVVNLLMRVTPLWQYLPWWLEWSEFLATTTWLIVPTVLGVMWLGIAISLMFFLKVPKKEEFKAVLPGEKVARAWQLATDFWVFGWFLAGVAFVGLIVWGVGSSLWGHVSMFADSLPHEQFTGAHYESLGQSFSVPKYIAGDIRAFKFTAIKITLMIDCRASGLASGCGLERPLIAIDGPEGWVDRATLVVGSYKINGGVESAEWTFTTWRDGHIHFTLFGADEQRRKLV